MTEVGHDVNNEPVRIGDIDSMGFKVGYIDEEGLAWQSRLERDCALGSSALHDADDRERVDPIVILDSIGVLDENKTAVLADYISGRAMRSLIKDASEREKSKHIERLFNYDEYWKK
jgi:hypothetical protein